VAAEALDEHLEGPSHDKGPVEVSGAYAGSLTILEEALLLAVERAAIRSANASVLESKKAA